MAAPELDATHAVVVSRCIGVDGQRLAHQPCGIIEPALLETCHAEEMERIGLLRRNQQDFFVQLFCGAQDALLMVGNGDLQRLFEAERLLLRLRNSYWALL
nr:hypothetical protein [Thiomonas sp.]